MRIGLISDTHIPDHAEKIPNHVKELFTGVDLILHAGDVYTSSVLDELASIAPVLAAEGDDDDWETIRDERVKDKHILTVENVTILLVHMRPRPLSEHMELFNCSVSDYVKLPPPGDVSTWHEFTHKEGAFGGGKDYTRIAVFGHTHKAIMKRNKAGVILINPGSATFPNYKRESGTIALLTINFGKVEANIVQL